MFVGWEGVGLASYLLIGFWFQKTSAASAGMKAFVVNRIGDFGFLIGIFLLLAQLRHADVSATSPRLLAAYPGWKGGILTAIAICLLVGATGKSAQLPLYVWLPDAMEGPTPVSALIHAATMVTAGVYMIARTHFHLRPLAVRADVGGDRGHGDGVVRGDHRAGADRHQARAGLLDGFAAGIHVPGLRRGGVFGGDLPPDDACVLQGAAVPCGRVGDPRDGRRTGHAQDGRAAEVHAGHVLDHDGGGVYDRGHPFLAAFYSKDAILSAAFMQGTSGKVFWFVGLVTAMLTSFYMFRLWYLTFFGERRAAAHDLEEHGAAVHARSDTKLVLEADHAHEPHESPWSMLGPLVILALLSVGGGWIGAGRFGAYLAPAVGAKAAEAGSNSLEWILTGLAVAVAAIGWFIAHRMYRARPEAPARARGLDVRPVQAARPQILGR